MIDSWRMTYRYQLNIFYSIDISFDNNIGKKINSFESIGVSLVTDAFLRIVLY